MADDIIEIGSKRPLSDKQLEQRRRASAKGAASLRVKNDKPASGIPANGPGHGDAKGTARAFSRDFQPASRLPRYSPDEMEALAQEALDTMVTTMRTSKSEYVRAVVGEKVRNQIVGTPVARVLHANVEPPKPLTLKAVYPPKSA